MSLARLAQANRAEHTGLSMSSGVRARRIGRAFHLTLARPAQLNALDHDLVVTLRSALEEAFEDPNVQVITMTGSGDRGLCAGGDLVFLHRAITADDGSAIAFWRDLYDLVQVIDESPVPIVGVLDGIVFGGGLGIAARTQLRLVTERSVIGMPETRIGFFPDTGGLHLLSHLPRHIGTYLGLCAQTVSAADAIDIGLADRFMLSDDIPRLLSRLEIDPLDEAVAAVTTEPPPGIGLGSQAWIEECFDANDPAVIVDRLRRHQEPAAQEAGAVLATRSPAAVAITLRGLRAASEMDLPADLAYELRLAESFHRHPDFREGIRARLIDKDRSPQWSPPR